MSFLIDETQINALLRADPGESQCRVEFLTAHTGVLRSGDASCGAGVPEIAWASSGEVRDRDRFAPLVPCHPDTRAYGLIVGVGSHNQSSLLIHKRTIAPLTSGRSNELKFLNRRFPKESRDFAISRRSSMLRINDEAPNFRAETTQGAIDFHQWIGDGWAILFSHPKHFTPMCPTHPDYIAALCPTFTYTNRHITA